MASPNEQEDEQGNEQQTVENQQAVSKISRIDGINKLITTPLRTIGDLTYVPGGAIRFAVGSFEFGIGLVAGIIGRGEEMRHSGLDTMGEGLKRIAAPLTTLINGLADTGSTLAFGTSAKPLENLAPDVKKNMLGDAWQARKESIKDKNSRQTTAGNVGTRLTGVGKILYGVTLAPFVETVKGAVHALHGLTAIATGAAKLVAGAITGNAQWRENGAAKLKAGGSMVLSGIAAPIAAPISLVGQGLYNMATGHQAVRTYGNLKKAEELKLKQGAGKFNEDKFSGKMTRTETNFINNMQNALQNNAQQPRPAPAAKTPSKGAEQGRS